MEAVEQRIKLHPLSSKCIPCTSPHQTRTPDRVRTRKTLPFLLFHISCHYLLTVLSHVLLSSCYTVPAGTIVYICIPDQTLHMVKSMYFISFWDCCILAQLPGLGPGWDSTGMKKWQTHRNTKMRWPRLSCWQSYYARESQRVYYAELDRKAGSWHTAEQGGGFVVCR